MSQRSALGELRLVSEAGRTRLTGLILTTLTLLAGCTAATDGPPRSSPGPSSSLSYQSPFDPASPCPGRSCTPIGIQTLPSGYVAGLWAPTAPGGHPVVELDHDAVQSQFVALRTGDPAGAKLACSRTRVQCVVTAEDGTHAGLAVVLFMVDGGLVQGAEPVQADTPTMAIADLNADGWLDIVVRDSDYRPNFAQGHLFDRTYIYDAATRAFRPGGCSALLPVPPAAIRAVTYAGSCPR